MTSLTERPPEILHLVNALAWANGKRSRLAGLLPALGLSELDEHVFSLSVRLSLARTVMFWRRGLGAAWIHAATIFNPSKRRRSLLAFEKEWAIRWRHEAALQITLYEFGRKEGAEPARTLHKMLCQTLSTGECDHALLPSEMTYRAATYQKLAQYVELFNINERKCGCPSRSPPRKAGATNIVPEP